MNITSLLNLKLYTSWNSGLILKSIVNSNRIVKEEKTFGVSNRVISSLLERIDLKNNEKGIQNRELFQLLNVLRNIIEILLLLRIE